MGWQEMMHMCVHGSRWRLAGTRRRWVCDSPAERNVSFSKHSAGMASRMSWRVKGGALARRLPPCRTSGEDGEDGARRREGEAQGGAAQAPASGRPARADVYDVASWVSRRALWWLRTAGAALTSNGGTTAGWPTSMSSAGAAMLATRRVTRRRRGRARLRPEGRADRTMAALQTSWVVRAATILLNQVKLKEAGAGQGGWLCRLSCTSASACICDRHTTGACPFITHALITSN